MAPSLANPLEQVNGRRCPCTSTDGNLEYCNCVMGIYGENLKIGWCFTQTAPCPPCEAGKYRTGCGCGPVVKGITSSVCSIGSCVATPAGI